MVGGVRALVENEHFRVTADDEARLVRMVRSTAPFASIAAMERTLGEVARTLEALPLGYALLLDSREAPARNDPEFEAAFGRARAPILACFERVAVLVRSAVGKLQVSRYTREAGGGGDKVGVFDDEGSALAYVAARSRAPRA